MRVETFFQLQPLLVLLLLSIVFLITLILIEKRHFSVYRFSFLQHDFNDFINALGETIIVFIGLLLLNKLSDTQVIPVAFSTFRNMPIVLAICSALVLTNLIQYWFHRFCHTIPFLWKIHSIHHSIETFTWLKGLRLHIVEILLYLLSQPFCLLLLGFTPKAMNTVVIIAAIHGTMTHCNVPSLQPVLSKIIVTPAFHRLHHTVEINDPVNYASQFVIFDVLFSSYRSATKNDMYKEVVHLNIKNTILKQLVYPFK